MNSNKSYINYLVPIAFLIASHIFCLYFIDFLFFKDNSVRVLAIIISFSPVLFAYILFGIFLNSMRASIYTSFVLFCLCFVHRIKNSLTGEPLVWNDLTAIDHFSLIKKYLEFKSILIILVFMFFLFSVHYFFKDKVCWDIKFFFRRLVLLLIISCVAFYPYLDLINQEIASKITRVLKKQDVSYLVWTWPINILKNGLPLHIIQTSRRVIPPKATLTDKNNFNKLKQMGGDNQKTIVSRPQKVIFVVCEACWYDTKNFEENFSFLEQLGFVKFRAISPVYGGGTVNSSFELLTGLPTGNHLTGVVYQEYADLMAEEIHSFPMYLKHMGYKTIALHDYNPKFWRRDLVKPKLGFQKFLSHQEMLDLSSDPFPRDKFVYQTALNEIEKTSKDLSFIFITTIHTHGPYSGDNNGEVDYKTRLNSAMLDFYYFSKEIINKYPNSLIFLIGDHKPAMTKYFYNKHVFGEEMFETIGDKNEDFTFNNLFLEIRGDVPAFLYYDSDSINKFSIRADKKAIYCIAEIIDDYFLKSGIPVFEHSRKICNSEQQVDLQTQKKEFPAWLYTLSILRQD